MGVEHYLHTDLLIRVSFNILGGIFMIGCNYDNLKFWVEPLGVDVIICKMHLSAITIVS